MLGIDDPYVVAAYLGSIGMMLFGLLYGVFRRNASPDAVTVEDRLWALEERESDRDL